MWSPPRLDGQSPARPYQRLGRHLLGDAFVYVGTSSTCATYDFGFGALFTLAPTSCWQELRVDLRAPASPTAGYNPASVADFGVQFQTGSAGGTPARVTFLIDSFSIE
jgi:hypothetical protein